MSIHPPQQPGPPYWKGVDEIAGSTGDLLYGTYRRSTNFAVSTGTEVEKRRGFVRAFDYRRIGPVHGTYLRQKDLRYHSLVDARGIQVFDTLPATPVYGTNLEHIGWPIDDFKRSDSATLGAGASGQKEWLEGISGTGGVGTMGTKWEILSNQAAIQNPNQSPAVTGMAEKAYWMPSLFYVSRMELDLSSFYQDDGSGNPTERTILRFAHGVCNQLITNGVARSRQLKGANAFLKDRGEYASRTGAILEVKATVDETTDWGHLMFTLKPFASQTKTGYIPIAGEYVEGGIGRAKILGGMNFNPFSTEMQTTHVVEFGLEDLGVEGKQRWRLRFWEGTTLATINLAPQTTPDLEAFFEWSNDEQYPFESGGQGYLQLPWGQDSTGLWAMYGDIISNGSDTSVLAIEGLEGSFAFFG